MSSLATVSFGSALRRSAACSSFSTVATTLWPRLASMPAAMRPKPLPAPVIRTILGIGSPSLARARDDTLSRHEDHSSACAARDRTAAAEAGQLRLPLPDAERFVDLSYLARAGVR